MRETYLIAKFDEDPCVEESISLLILTTDNQDMLKPYQRYGYDIYISLIQMGILNKFKNTMTMLITSGKSDKTLFLGQT